jgi:hypothetical protein
VTLGAQLISMEPKDNKWYWRFRIGVTLTILLVLYSSCIDIRYPAKGKTVDLKDNTSLIYGRVQVIEDNVDVTRDFCDPMSFFSSTDRLLSFSLLDLKWRKVAMHVVAEHDGSFYWVLPAGYYRIIKIGYRTDIDPYLAFRINGGNRYVYVGNIVLKSESAMVPHISLRKHKANLSTVYDLIDIYVEDNFECETNVLKAKFPDRAKVIEKSLIFTNYDK